MPPVKKPEGDAATAVGDGSAADSAALPFSIASKEASVPAIAGEQLFGDGPSAIASKEASVPAIATGFEITTIPPAFENFSDKSLEQKLGTLKKHSELLYTASADWKTKGMKAVPLKELQVAVGDIFLADVGPLKMKAIGRLRRVGDDDEEYWMFITEVKSATEFMCQDVVIIYFDDCFVCCYMID